MSFRFRRKLSRIYSDGFSTLETILLKSTKWCHRGDRRYNAVTLHRLYEHEAIITLYSDKTVFHA